MTFACIAMMGQRAAGLSFDIKPISDADVISREPTISEANLVSWISARSENGSVGSAQITVMSGGTKQDLPNPDGGISSLKPQAQNKSVIWIGTYTNIFGDVSSRLVESPSRDEGGAEELRAIYTVKTGPGIPPTLVPMDTSNVFRTILFTNAQGEIVASNIPEQVSITNEVRRHPSGASELVLWNSTGLPRRLTHDFRNDFSPSLWDGQVTWQKAKGWPFGWEIFLWKDGVSKQLTTNFYYDMAPKIQGDQIVWYGWDGHDFEIFLYDQAKDMITQVTSNRYDDVSPVLWNGMIAWEGYPSAEGDIFVSMEAKDTNGLPARVIKKVSDNVEDDINPRIWNGKVVWQGFDGDDFEIYLFDGEKTRKVTANNYDDTNPDIRDGLVTWQGYKDNWDAEIFAWDMTNDPVQVTENEEEDRDAKTAGGRIVWQQDTGSKSQIYLATPK